MTSANRILDFEVFQHPELDRFVSLLEAGLRTAARSVSSHAWSDPDEIISFFARNDRETLKRVLNSAVGAVVGEKVPYDRLGDALISYARFMFTQKRTPKVKLGFNDVLYHIKTSDEILKPLRVFVSDKEFCKSYVKEKVGDGYNVPTIAVLRSAQEVDDFDFPAVCAIKPTHMSGKYLFPGPDEELDREKIKPWLKRNHYFLFREANYRRLEPKIIVEESIAGYYEIKFFCLYGKPKLVKAIRGGTKNRTVNFFDTHWNELPAGEAGEKYPRAIPRPRRHDDMVAVAEKLSAPFNFVRIDLYSNDEEIFVGEITNCDNAASMVHKPEGAHDLLSRVIFGSVPD